jgi:thioredoxin-dependent peroxiredoxin
VIKEGDKAPDFSLETDSGERVSLKDFEDKTLVLYFYPRDSTPGCTREAQAFSAARAAIEMAGGAVVGVSRDTVKSHCTFRDKYGLTIPLAADPDLAAHKAYGAWGDKLMYGKKVTGCIRSTFLVHNGRVVKVWPSVKVDGHAEDVLQAIGEMRNGPSSRRIPTLPPPGLKKKAKAAAKTVKTSVKKAVKKAVKKVAAKAKKVVAKVKKTAAKAKPAAKKKTQKK